MRVIKRYPNRKLYDTARRRYVTLEQVAELIRRGAEVRVVDHESGGDITTAVLSQILHEREKARPGLPRHLLAGIIRQGGRIREALSGRLDSLLGPRLEAAIRRLGLPTREDLAALERRVRQLERKLAVRERAARRRLPRAAP
jgi:polyhydroxyalkanoate synthesis repressor PhaR